MVGKRETVKRCTKKEKSWKQGQVNRFWDKQDLEEESMDKFHIALPFLPRSIALDLSKVAMDKRLNAQEQA